MSEAEQTRGPNSGQENAPEHRTVMAAADIDRALTRISHEIVESNRGTDDLILLGIPRRGFPLAKRLGVKIAAIADTPSNEPLDPATIVGQLDVTMYRDDLRRSTSRTPEPTRLPPSGIDNKVVVLVDDVLFSGRTIRAALDAINDFGRPAAVRLAVLVDRGHRQLPIRADFVGKNLPTAAREKVRVLSAAVDAVAPDEEEVRIENPAGA